MGTKVEAYRITGRSLVALTLFAVLATSVPVAAQPPYPKLEEEPERHRSSHLGVALGYAGTSSVVGEVFGEGTDALIYVNQKLYKPLGIRASFGSVYLGSTEPAAEWDTYLTGLDFFGSSFTNFTMKFNYISIGPSLQLNLGDRHSFLGSASFVFYSVVLDLSSLGAHRLDVKNSRTGFNADLMYAFWIGDSWGLNFQAQWHWIDTTSAWDDLYNVFVRGDSDPQFVSFLVGVHLGYK
jgi:hypothetical protein